MKKLLDYTIVLLDFFMTIILVIYIIMNIDTTVMLQNKDFTYCICGFLIIEKIRACYYQLLLKLKK